MDKVKKVRLDNYLVEKGFFESRAKAQASIMAGQVLVDEQKIDKPGTSIKEGTDLMVWAIGSMVAEAEKTAALLKEKGISAGVVNMRFAKPLDEELLLADATRTHRIVTMEEGVVKGGVGDAVMETLNNHGLLQETKVLPFGIPDEFISQGDKKLLMHDIGLAPEQMAEQVAQWMQKC